MRSVTKRILWETSKKVYLILYTRLFKVQITSFFFSRKIRENFRIPKSTHFNFEDYTSMVSITTQRLSERSDRDGIVEKLTKRK